MKNLKFTNELKGIGPKLKWFLFTELQDLKLTSDYIDLICPGLGGKSQDDINPVESLEKIVRHSLIREFTPEIQNLKSFDVLVDTVMFNIQKNALNGDIVTEEELDAA